MEKFDRIRAALGDPYYASDDVLLFAGDCLGVMARVETATIDLTVTSPPYNIGKEYEQPLPLLDYVAWCGKWMTRIHELTESDGAFWLNLGYGNVPTQGKAVPLPYLLWDQSPFFLLQEIVWNYAAGVAARHTFSPRNEKFLWYVKDQHDYHFDLDAVRDTDVKYPNQTKNGKLRCNPLGKSPGDVWMMPKVTSGTDRAAKERTAHPAQFPERVIERIIKASSAPGDLVLDPFVGSGTAAVVAARLGRKFVGIEMRPDYLDLAVARLRSHRLAATQLPLEDCE